LSQFPIDTSLVLVQFRQKVGASVPEGVRDLGTETDLARDERARRGADKGPMRTLLERNGASPAKVTGRLLNAGLRLVDAHAQVRYTHAGEFHTERPYRLVTFVFSKGEVAQGPTADAFATFARRRYEYVTAKVGMNDDGQPIVCIVCKMVANPATQLRYLEDPEAEVFGLAVSRAVPKRDRTTGTALATA